MVNIIIGQSCIFFEILLVVHFIGMVVLIVIWIDIAFTAVRRSLCRPVQIPNLMCLGDKCFEATLDTISPHEMYLNQSEEEKPNREEIGDLTEQEWSELLEDEVIFFN